MQVSSQARIQVCGVGSADLSATFRNTVLVLLDESIGFRELGKPW